MMPKSFTSAFGLAVVGLALATVFASNARAAEAQAEAPGEKPFFLWADNSVTLLPYG